MNEPARGTPRTPQTAPSRLWHGERPVKTWIEQRGFLPRTQATLERAATRSRPWPRRLALNSNAFSRWPPNGSRLSCGRACTTSAAPGRRRRHVRPRHVAWAELLRRGFGLDVLACPDCGGRLHLVATIADPRVIARILAHLGLPLAPPAPAPPRQPSWLPAAAH